MMGAAAATTHGKPAYTAVPLAGLVGRDGIPFPLYLRTADETWVLYRPREFALDESHLGRLMAEGIGCLYVREEDRASYFQRVETALDDVLRDRHLPLPERADVLYGVATMVAGDLLAAPPDRETAARAQRLMMATSGFLLREREGFPAVRRVLSVHPGLARHSLTVAFLSMGLARVVAGSDAGALTMAGLGGLLHDVGKVGHEHLDSDPEHTTRGAEYLQGLGLPRDVVECARSHHECHDGSGFPRGLRGAEIPELARVVGIVNTFDKIYSSQRPRVGVFDALRILAQAYRGCFDERLAQGLVKMFR